MFTHCKVSLDTVTKATTVPDLVLSKWPGEQLSAPLACWLLIGAVGGNRWERAVGIEDVDCTLGLAHPLDRLCCFLDGDDLWFLVHGVHLLSWCFLSAEKS